MNTVLQFFIFSILFLKNGSFSSRPFTLLNDNDTMTSSVFSLATSRVHPKTFTKAKEICGILAKGL